MNENALRQHIESAWSDRSLIQTEEVRGAVAEVMAQLDRGTLRVAHPEADGTWTVNEWVKQAVLLNFPIQTMETVEVGPFEFHDKMPLKRATPRRAFAWCLTLWCVTAHTWRRIAS